MTTENRRPALTTPDVLKRYKDEALPAFAEIALNDVNQVGNLGERPLHVASVRGSIDELMALIEGGADINAPGELGKAHMAVIQLLLDHGATPTAKNNAGESRLEVATAKERDDIRVLLQDRPQKSAPRRT